MKLYKKILILLICCLPLFISAQENSKKKKKQEKIEKQKELEALKNYQKAVKRHHKIQSPKTRKGMTHSRKESGNISTGRKVFFLKRWFSGKINK
jgi:hypothetical protein